MAKLPWRKTCSITHISRVPICKGYEARNLTTTQNECLSCPSLSAIKKPRQRNCWKVRNRHRLSQRDHHASSATGDNILGTEFQVNIWAPHKINTEILTCWFQTSTNAQLTCEQRVLWTKPLRRKHLTQPEVRAPSVANHCWIVCYVLPQTHDLLEKELLFLTSFLKQTTRLKPTWSPKATNPRNK